MTTKAKSKQTPRLKRPRGALLRAIVAGHISTRKANEMGYMGKARNHEGEGVEGVSKPKSNFRQADAASDECSCLRLIAAG